MDMRTNFQRAMTRKGYEGAIAIFILFLFIGNNLYADNSNYLEYMQAPPEAQTSVSAQPTVPTAPSPEASNELPTTTASLMGGALALPTPTPPSEDPANAAVAPTLLPSTPDQNPSTSVNAGTPANPGISVLTAQAPSSSQPAATISTLPITYVSAPAQNGAQIPNGGVPISSGFIGIRHMASDIYPSIGCSATCGYNSGFDNILSFGAIEKGPIYQTENPEGGVTITKTYIFRDIHYGPPQFTIFPSFVRDFMRVEVVSGTGMLGDTVNITEVSDQIPVSVQQDKKVLDANNEYLYSCSYFVTVGSGPSGKCEGKYVNPDFQNSILNCDPDDDGCPNPIFVTLQQKYQTNEVKIAELTAEINDLAVQWSQKIDALRDAEDAVQQKINQIADLEMDISFKTNTKITTQAEIQALENRRASFQILLATASSVEKQMVIIPEINRINELLPALQERITVLTSEISGLSSQKAQANKDLDNLIAIREKLQEDYVELERKIMAKMQKRQAFWNQQEYIVKRLNALGLKL